MKFLFRDCKYLGKSLDLKLLIELNSSLGTAHEIRVSRTDWTSNYIRSGQGH